jgi:hypothetical protein
MNLIEKDIQIAIDICNETPFKLKEEYKYKYYKIESPVPFNLVDDINIDYNIIRKNLNNEINIPLYISVGISNNSFCNNLFILNNNLDKIKNKYSEIIFIFSDSKDAHRLFIKKSKEINPSVTDLFIINDIMKDIMAVHYDKIIRKINKDSGYNNEIDYLGVSFSGGIGIFLSQINKIKIRNLILCAPGCLEGLKNVNKDQNIILGWCIQDTKVSYKTEGLRFISELKEFKNKIIILTDLGNITNDDLTHRLQDGIFDLL